MANLGNTGQRYKTTKLVNVQIDGNKLLHVLACGHNYHSSGWSDIERAAAIVRERIGKRQRCDKCK